jgi:flavin-dependent dehydrogenase
MTGSNEAEEAVIVGGGLAGAAAACALARAGRSPLLIERESSPKHKVCGEFLSIEAQAYLADLGIDLDSLDASHITSIRLISGERSAEADLPFVARGISRMNLDEALLHRASSHGARIVKGPAVRTISFDREEIRIHAAELGDLRARTLFLATGKHDVRGVKRPNSSTTNDLIAFKVHYQLTQQQRRSLDGTIELILFADGYAGLQMIEAGTANLCLVVKQQRFKEVGKSWPGLLHAIGDEAPALRGRLDGAVPLFERPLSISQIPYGFVHMSHPDEPQGLFRIGDQAGVIPSYTGDGMAIALHSARLAASFYLTRGQAGPAFHRQLRADILHQIRLSSLLYEAGRRPFGQRAILSLCQAWPSMMRYVASSTRLRSLAVRRVLVAP